MSWEATAIVERFMLHPSSDGMRLGSRHTAVLYMLANECRDDMTCWPSLATIARATKMSRRSAVRVMDELAGMKGSAFPEGLVTRIGQFQADSGWATTLYQLNMPDCPRVRRPSRKGRETGVILSLLSGQSGAPATPVEKSTGVKHDSKLVTDTTQSSVTGGTRTYMNQQTEPPPMDGGGGDGSAAPPSEEETDGLKDKLVGMGIAEDNAKRIVRDVDRQRILQQVTLYLEARDDGSEVGVAYLAKCLLSGGSIAPVGKGKKTKPKEPPAPGGSPAAPPAPPHQVDWTCKICREAYSRMSNESLTCPNCGATAMDQEVVDLVAKRIMPLSRLDRLPERAREILKTRSEAEGVKA